MANNLPIAPSNPAEVLDMSPEAIEVANAYLEAQDIQKTALQLGIEPQKVSSILSRREVKAYIDHVFMEVGFNSRYRMRAIMDTVIEKKLQEMEEADMGSSKDITEILALSHKMSMDLLDKQIKLEQVKNQNTIRNQTNVQINSAGAELSNYDILLNKLKENK